SALVGARDGRGSVDPAGPGAFEADLGVVHVELTAQRGFGHVVVPAADHERGLAEAQVRLLPARGGDGHVGRGGRDLRWPAELQEDDGRDELRLATTSRLHAESLFEPPLVALRAILVPTVEEEPLIRHGVERLPEEVAFTED